METPYYTDWNRVMYYISDIYRATKRFKTGDPAVLGDKIRTTAVSISAGLNAISTGQGPCNETTVYSMISSVSVLETYLQLARQYGLLKDNRLLNGELLELKRILGRMADSLQEEAHKG